MNNPKLSEDKFNGEEIKIIPKPDSISWQEITDLLHLAFAEKKERGLQYLATHQDVGTTKKRVGNGICLVALLGGRLVGTMTLQIYKPNVQKKRWHNQALYGYASQDAVHPDYKGHGIGNLLQKERIKICFENNVDELLMHTSIQAKELINWWKRKGAQKVELMSSPVTNYYSVRLRIPIKGKRFSNNYVKMKYYAAAIRCIAQKNKHGKSRLLGKLFNKLNAR